MHIDNMNVYSAESQVRNLKRVFTAMFSGLLRGRYLAYRLFIREIKADYSQARFGILWDFLEPIMLAVVFILLRRGNVINSGAIAIPYHVFIIYGLLLWHTFTEGLLLPLNIMQRSKDLLTQVKIPPEALLLAIFLKILFNSFFRIVVMFSFSFATDTLSWIGCMKFLLWYPTIILGGMAFGVLLAPLNTVYNDVEKIIRISLRPLLYSTPVLYAVPPLTLLIYFNRFNPIGIILCNLRSLATQNLFQNMPVFMITLVLLSIIFVSGWLIFHLSIPILSERL